MCKRVTVGSNEDEVPGRLQAQKESYNIPTIDVIDLSAVHWVQVVSRLSASSLSPGRKADYAEDGTDGFCLRMSV